MGRRKQTIMKNNRKKVFSHFRGPNPKPLVFVNKFYSHAFLYDVLNGNLPEKKFLYTDYEKDFFLEDFENFVFSLKEHLLEVILYSCACEVRHAYNMCFKNHLKAASDIIKDLNKKYRGFCKGRSKREKSVYKITNDTKRDLAPKRALKHFKNNKQMLMKFCEEVFGFSKWDCSYGGKPWKNGASAWLKLYDAKSISEIIAVIDHCYDLQHHNGLLFNKHPDYQNKRGVEKPLKRMLTIKRNTQHFNDLVFFKFSANQHTERFNCFLPNTDYRNITKLGFKTGYWNPTFVNRNVFKQQITL